MVQNILAIGIVILVVGYAIYRIFKRKNGNHCDGNCGCK